MKLITFQLYWASTWSSCKFSCPNTLQSVSSFLCSCSELFKRFRLLRIRSSATVEDHAKRHVSKFVMFHEVWEFERFQTAKETFKVIQGHWQWCHSMSHIHVRFHVSIPLQLCLYLAPLTICTRNLKCLTSCTDSKDMIGEKIKNRSRDPWLRPLGVVCHPRNNTWYYIIPPYKFGDSLFNRSGDRLWLRASKFKIIIFIFIIRSRQSKK